MGAKRIITCMIRSFSLSLFYANAFELCFFCELTQVNVIHFPYDCTIGICVVGVGLGLGWGVGRSWLGVASCPCRWSDLKQMWYTVHPWEEGSLDRHGAHLGPTGPRWAPCWSHELCYLGCLLDIITMVPLAIITRSLIILNTSSGTRYKLLITHDNIVYFHQSCSISLIFQSCSISLFFQSCSISLFRVDTGKRYPFPLRLHHWHLCCWCGVGFGVGCRAELAGGCILPVPVKRPETNVIHCSSLRERFVGPTWGPSGADRTQVGPMLVPWTLLSGLFARHNNHGVSSYHNTVTHYFKHLFWNTI